MKTKLITIKTSEKAHQLLRIISAYTGETHYQVLERILAKELERVQKEQKPE